MESVGLLMTLYAWVVALVSLPLMLATRTWERRRLLVATFLLFIVSNGLGAGASSYGLFVVSRLGVALAHAIFWASENPHGQIPKDSRVKLICSG